MANRITVGDRAPDFTLPDQEGNPVSLQDFVGKSHLVLYFYPQDDTPGCTAQACTFRDQYEDFVDAGAQVVGVSSDDEASHQAFAKRHKLPFVLLSDAKGAARKAFGVPSSLGILPGRVTYVIDREGAVRHIFNSQLNARKHIVEALNGLAAIDG